MRTTVDITDELLRRAKQRAADEGVPLRQIFESALRNFLAPTGPNRRFRLRWTPDPGRLRPGVDLDDRDSLFDRMDGRG